MVRPKRVAHVVVNVTDLERSQRFYCDGLGMAVTGEFPGQMVFLYFGEAGREPHPFYHDIGLYRVDRAAPEDFRKASGVGHVALLMVRQADVAEAAERLREQGFKVLKSGQHKEDGYTYCYVEDPDRNVIELVAPSDETIRLSGGKLDD
jgi:catechol 2,3-dioxygenase-like lactoylglutathione lyase family enzyme